MCITTGICGGTTGLLGMVIAVLCGGVSCFGIAAISCVGVCGIMSFFLFIACMLGVGSVLAVFGVSIADIMMGSTVGGYLGYLGTFIEQGGNLYDACRICIAGK